MAPIPAKRYRAPTELSDDDLDVQTAGSTFRHDARKRQRVSTALGDDETDLGLSDGFGSDRSDTRQNDSNSYDLDTQIFGGDMDDDMDLDRILGGDMDDDVELDRILGSEETRFAALTKIIRNRYKNIKDNHAADNAIIEEVRCINFMCHAHLTVTLGPLINFIIGHNGSGKSAVLTALTLCLGGKATATNRGQNLRSFIKEGEEAAILAVKIKNQGSAAYKPDLYGKSIIVERHFSKSGTSGFKIKNVKEKVLSTKKADLEDIIDAFQLQMDNPMNVLSQDMARQFLNQSTPADKYRFFLEGTQLAALDRDYRILGEQLEETEEKLLMKKEDVQTLKDKVKEAKRKNDMAARQEQMIAKAKKYRQQQAWKQVEDMEATLEMIDGEIAKCDQDIEQKTRDAEEASNVFNEANREKEEAEGLVGELEASLAPIVEDRDRLKVALDKGKQELQNVLSQQRDIRSTIKADQAIVAKLEQEVAEEIQRQEDANGGEHGRRLEEIQEAKARAEEKQTEYEIHGRNFSPLDRATAAAEAALERFKPVIEAKRNDVRQQELQIQNIRKNQGKWMAGFDQNLPNLLRAIETDTRFHHRPVGPVGRHIKLLKPEWSYILEKSTGTTLNAFVVTNKHDEGILRDIMRRTSYPRDRRNHTPILIGDPTPIDTSANEPDSSLLTWMRALKFDNDLVRNQLIINNGIEQTVLIEDFNKAQAFAYPGDRSRPPKVRQVYCMNKNRVDGIRFGWSSSGAGTQTPVLKQNRPPRMQTETESHINVATMALQQSKRELNEAENQLREKQTALTRARQALERHRREYKTLQVDAQRAQEEAEKMQDDLEADTPQAGRLEDLQSQKREANEAEEAHRRMFEDAQAERDMKDESQRAILANIQEKEREIIEANGKVNKAMARVQRMADRRDRALRDKNRALEVVGEVQDQRASYQRDREEQQRSVEEYLRDATPVGPRIPVPAGETVKSLSNKYERLKNELERQHQELGASRQELSSAMFEAVVELQTAISQERDIDRAVQTLKRTLTNRKARLAMFRRLIADRSRIMFVYLLSIRKFRGNMNINTKQKELDISVEPDITKVDDQGRQTRTLSGGEKSFSTVCLLLSLWDAMNAPTRCLDEFDVFMDSVNREISMKMIIEACRGSPSRQFLFITPQAMGNVRLGHDVKIIKMSDPERGQKTLPFGS